ncbi:MAG: hypothetical protein WB616_11190 [Candidatus Sulfotelmatobacter sp.]
MNAIVQFVVRHGYSVLFAAVFARQIGLPVPAPMFLLAAGALAATGKLGLVPALGLAITACALADWVWYEAGREWGDRVVHFIHRLTPDPDAANRRSKRVFARYGNLILVLDKFVPGLDAVAPPWPGHRAPAECSSWPLKLLVPASGQPPIPESGMSSAMTWTARLPTSAEQERFWQALRWLHCLFSPPASWFDGIAARASLDLCAHNSQSHEMWRLGCQSLQDHRRTRKWRLTLRPATA